MQVAGKDAEALMRSRYSAYVLKRADYVRTTWHASTRPSTWLWMKSIRSGWGWRSENIHSRTTRPRSGFVARYKVGGRAHRLHEISRFVREEGRWYYVDGEISGT